MSLKAMTWALEDAPVKDSTALVILWALADRAHDDGTAAWPSVEWLAHRARCTTRSVHRHLRTLEAEGIIRRGDQRYVAHLRADHRPTVWDLDLTRRRGDNLSPRGADEVTPVVERGDTDGSHGVTPVTERGDAGVTQSFLEPTTEPPQEPHTSSPAAPSRAPEPVIGFEAFWKHYPRKVGKDAARRAWLKAVRRTAGIHILRGVEAYSQDPNLPEMQFVPHPSKWLNDGRWADGPLPARSGTSALASRDRSAFGPEWEDGTAAAGWEAAATPRQENAR